MGWATYDRVVNDTINVLVVCAVLAWVAYYVLWVAHSGSQSRQGVHQQDSILRYVHLIPTNPVPPFDWQIECGWLAVPLGQPANQPAKELAHVG